MRDRDRKLLWGRSGNRCAFCREELVVERTATDREAIVGEEAHIVSGAPDGPRHGEPLAGEVDDYENLILLCRRHHRIIDTQPGSHPAAELRRIKAEHEAWVARELSVVSLIGPRPVDLPMLPTRLVNRWRELDALDAAADRAAGAPRPTVVVLSGMHGVGKSAVGAHWVMRNWTRFRGQLVGDLSRRRGAIDVGEVLGDFLRQLGVAGEAVPATMADRRRLFLEATAGQPVVVLLDGIDEPAQVRNLMPAGPGSIVVVTSNDVLDELLYDGAVPVPVDPLDPPTSEHLLADLLDAERIAAEPQAVERLVELCAGLPLALRVCGGRLAGTDRRRSIAWLVGEIERAGDRIQALSGSGFHDLEAIFEAARVGLPPDLEAIYLALGLHPPGSFTAATVAPLVGAPEAEVRSGLRRLQAAHLVEPAGDERLRVHDLIRHHTVLCAQRHLDPVAREDAYRRLLDWMVAALRRADRAVFPDRLRLVPETAEDRDDLPELTSPRAAFDWFAAERHVVSASIDLAVRMGWERRVWELTEPLWPFCYNQKWYALWFSAYTAAVDAGVRMDDLAVIARTRSAIARAYSDHGDHVRAAEEMRQAERAASRCGNAWLHASVTEFAGIVRFVRGDVEGALADFERSRKMHERVGDGPGMDRAVALQDYHIGKCLNALGRPERALVPLEQAHVVLAAVGDDVVAARARRRTGQALHDLGRLEEAAVALHDALAAAQRLDLRHDQAEALEVLAMVAEAAGDEAMARHHRDEAIVLLRQIGHPRGERGTGPGRAAQAPG